MARMPMQQGVRLVQHAPGPGCPLKLGFIGSGRAAAALGRGFARAGHEVLIARRGPSAARLAEDLVADLLSPAELLGRADVVFLAVPDAAILTVVTEIAALSVPGDGRLVVHLAGSLGSGALEPLEARGFRTAAIHPLQVLSGWRIAAGTGFAIEASEAASGLAERLVKDLGGVVLAVPAEGRAAYHAAAVIAANLGMTMLGEAVNLMVGQGIGRAEALQGLGALVRGGLEAAMDRDLPGALTGPVSRGDLATVAAHLEALAADPELRRAYAATSLLTLRQVQPEGRPAGPGEAAAIRGLLEDAL